MPSLNKVMLIGNVTRDPKLRYTPKGTACLDLGLAINRSYTSDGERQEETTFVDVTYWGKSAETIGQHAKKGEAFYVEGRLQLDTWQDKQTGQNRSKLKVTGDSFQFLGGKGHSGSQEPRRDAGASRQYEGGSDAQGVRSNEDEDEIPF